MTVTRLTDLDKPSIAAALSAVMAEVQKVGKGDRNQQQGYNFRGIDAVVNAVGPALRNNGVVVVPLVEDVSYAVVEVGQKRTPMRECTVRVRYVFHGPAGDRIECVTVGEAMDSGDKSTPKAMSVAFRVALLQALCIPTDEQDADSHTYERAAARPPEPVWDPVGQETLRTAWEAEITDAKTSTDLDDIAKRLVAAKRPEAGEDRISPATFDHLKIAVVARRADFKPEEVKPDAPVPSLP